MTIKAKISLGKGEVKILNVKVMKANKARKFLISMRYGRYNARCVGFKIAKMAEEELTERAIDVIREMFPGEYEIIDRFRTELEKEE